MNWIDDTTVSDALIVAMDMLNRRTAKKKYQRRVFMVTDGGMQGLNMSDYGTITEFFVKMQAHLNVIGINFADEPDPEDDGMIS